MYSEQDMFSSDCNYHVFDDPRLQRYRHVGWYCRVDTTFASLHLWEWNHIWRTDSKHSNSQLENFISPVWRGKRHMTVEIQGIMHHLKELSFVSLILSYHRARTYFRICCHSNQDFWLTEKRGWFSVYSLFLNFILENFRGRTIQCSR